MNAVERRAVTVLSFVMMARMLGLFLLLPVLALHADRLAGASPALVGLAVGAFGLTQALFQFPFGLLSDRYGRRPLIVVGLLVFACGSLVAARAGSIAMLIAGRALQGTGAISGAVTALVADLTRFEVRTRAMAIVGVSIGASFVAALVLGPLIAGVIGVRGLFLVAVALALVAIALVVFVVPSAAAQSVEEPQALRVVLAARDLLVLDAGVFILHLLLTALFVALPYVLRDGLGIAEPRHGFVYIGALALSLAGTVPMIVAAERGRAPEGALRLSAVLLLAGFALFAAGGPLWVVVAGLALFFTGFNFLEARLPAEVSRRAPESRRGAAFAIFATAQLLGAFTGAAAAGVLLGRAGPSGVFAAGALVAMLGAVAAAIATRGRTAVA